MGTQAATHLHVCQPDITFQFLDGHSWAYAGYEWVWMHEVPIGAAWADCPECDRIMDELGEPPPNEIPFYVVTENEGVE